MSDINTYVEGQIVAQFAPESTLEQAVIDAARAYRDCLCEPEPKRMAARQKLFLAIQRLDTA